jgi:hypothetical protein
MTRNIIYSVLCSKCNGHWYCSRILDQPASDVEGVLSAIHSDDLCHLCDERGPKEIIDINDERQNSLSVDLLAARLCKRIKAHHIVNDKAVSFIGSPFLENDRIEASIKVFKDKQEYLYYKISGQGGCLQGLTVMGPVADVQRIKKNLKEDFYFGIPLERSAMDQEMDYAVLKLFFKEY